MLYRFIRPGNTDVLLIRTTVHTVVVDVVVVYDVESARFVNDLISVEIVPQVISVLSFFVDQALVC